ncbi:MAG TPA: hypothetical protein DCG75_06545 [Bacteroidales bacterium]|nr:hypothetical protein [Bacteroidales bacterium]
MQTNFETIEKYIDGELKGNELLKFEELLSIDPDIKRDYKLSLELNNSIMEDDVIALRETMNYMYQDETIVKRIPTVFTKRKFYYYAAASAALLIATGGLMQRLSGPEMNNTRVFEKYYAPYEVTVTYRSGNTEVDRLLLNALERYEEKDYEYALVLFEEVLESRQNDMAVNLYSGISYMEEEKYQKATKSFSNIISDKDNLFIEQANWYLAMCYLKTEKTDKAQDVLREIINEESYYKEQAARVLEDIGN